MTVLHGLSNIASYAYTVAPSGHRIAATETILRDPIGQPTTLTRLYAYDRTYRLTNETIGGTGFGTPATLGYAYDKVGNRLQLASTLGAISSASYSFDSNDRLNTSSAEQFDNNGNTLFASGFGMTQADHYDFENRLVLRTESGRTIQIVYDGDGNRVKKTVTTATNTVTTWFLVDTVNPTGYAQVLEEHVSINSQASAITRVYAYGHDLISQDQVIGSQWQVSFYGYDGHGNTRFLTDGNGFVTDTYDYDAFGNLIATTGSTPNSYRFTGEQYDADLRLYLLRARYNNCATGRFWNMDEFSGFPREPQSLHKYAYCHNNPIMWRDPSGAAVTPLAQTALSVGILGTLTSAASISFLGLGLVLTAEDRDQWPPDGYIATVSFTGGARGFDAGFSVDIVYSHGKWLAYVSGFAGLAPLSRFKAWNNATSLGITAGAIWNMDSPEQWSGLGVSVTIPLSSSGLLFRSMFNNMKMFYAVRQLSKYSHNPRWSHMVLQMSLSSGAVAWKAGVRSNSFAVEASFAFGPFDLEALSRRVGISLTDIGNRLSAVSGPEDLLNMAQ